MTEGFYYGALPPPGDPLIGRDTEVEKVKDLLLQPDRKILTLIGAPGIGKTALALQSAAELAPKFEHGVAFVSLAGVRDHEQVINVIARELGIPQVVDVTPAERLRQHLADKHLLLILDNFEQVKAAASQLIDLTNSAEMLKLLITSREALEIDRERPVYVQPLALPGPTGLSNPAELVKYPAVALFVRSAQEVDNEFKLTEENASTVAKICAQLGGIPLAIKLASAWVDTLTEKQILEQLKKDLLRFLKMEGTIEWSYALLNLSDRALFWRLAVFVGGWTVPAAEAVCSVAGDGPALFALDGIRSLFHKSLLERNRPDEKENRFRMLPPIQEFALKKLLQSNEHETLMQQHAEYYLNWVEKQQSPNSSQKYAEWLKQLTDEHDNLRTAIQWTLQRREASMALRFGSALWQFWELQGFLIDGRGWLEQALQLDETNDTASLLKAKACYALGTLLLYQDEFADARRHYQESLKISEKIGHDGSIAWSHYGLGEVAKHCDELTDATAHYEHSLKGFQDVQDEEGIAWALHELGEVSQLRGNFHIAREYYRKSLNLFHEELGDIQGIATTLVMYGRISRDLDDYDYDDAARLLEQGLSLFENLQNKRWCAWVQHDLAEVEQLRNNHDTAMQLYKKSLMLFEELGIRLGIAWSLHNQVYIWSDQGQPAQASECLKKSASHFLELKDDKGIAACLFGRGSLAVAQGNFKEAAHSLGRSDHRYKASGKPRVPVLRQRHEKTRLIVLTQLGEEVFKKEYEAGRAEEAKTMAEFQVLPSRSPYRPPYSSILPNGEQLTIRELEILCLLEEGKTNKQIAEQCTIAPNTVRTHVRNICNKLGVKSRAEASHFARQHNIC
jgi:predicted ATPase/DNA-binding CsgD family transcriptional regulator